MAGSQIIKIELNDSELLFRQKCNQNFSQLVKGAATNIQKLQIKNISDDEAVAALLAQIQDKVSFAELTTTIEAALASIVGGTGIVVENVGGLVTISLGCPIPVGGVYWHSASDNPSTQPGFAGTTWSAITHTAGGSMYAWKRLT